MPYKTNEEVGKAIDEMNVDIGHPKSLMDEDVWENMKFFIPIAWDLLKPSLKEYVSSLRAADLRALIEGMEGHREDMNMGLELNGYKTGYIESLDDVKSLLTSLLESNK